MILARAGIADFIQPGLLPFQPNLDECMDTFGKNTLMTDI